MINYSTFILPHTLHSWKSRKAAEAATTATSATACARHRRPKQQFIFSVPNRVCVVFKFYQVTKLCWTFESHSTHSHACVRVFVFRRTTRSHQVPPTRPFLLAIVPKARDIAYIISIPNRVVHVCVCFIVLFLLFYLFLFSSFHAKQSRATFVVFHAAAAALTALMERREIFTNFFTFLLVVDLAFTCTAYTANLSPSLSSLMHVKEPLSYTTFTPTHTRMHRDVCVTWSFIPPLFWWPRQNALTRYYLQRRVTYLR